MTRKRSGGRRGLMASAAIAAFVILFLLMMAGLGQVVLSGDTVNRDATTRQHEESKQEQTRPLTKRSPAIRLAIPAIGVDTRLVRLRDAARTDTIELPPPRAAGWYTEAASPGEAGVAIVAGYIRPRDDVPGVFARLRKLREGHSIRVRRADGRVAVYRVTSIASYATGEFPAEEFYGSNGQPVLRVVTTGGKIRPRAPQGNVVVDAALADVR